MNTDQHRPLLAAPHPRAPTALLHRVVRIACLALLLLLALPSRPQTQTSHGLITLNTARVVLTIDGRRTEQAVTLRLTTPPAAAQKNQWLIGEMLHIDWVSP